MQIDAMETHALLEKALQGSKLYPDEAIHLCLEGELLDLAMAARILSARANPQRRVGYRVSRTVIYSNVCQPHCPFCSGTVTLSDPAAFTRSAAEVAAEAAAAVAAGATQIILQGGHRIDLPWEYYLNLVQAIAARCPGVQILAFSPTEIMLLNAAYQKGTAQVIAELKNAGMGGLMAGGDESLTTRAPEYRALLRGPWSEWFDVVHRCADAGLPVVAPFAFGLGETARERVGHLYRLRAVQERTAAAGRPAFAAVAVFTPAQAPPAAAAAEELLHVEGQAVHAAPAAQPPVSGYEYLRMVALARILVPGPQPVQASFLTQGAKVAQVALDCGADDLGGTHLQYQQAELAAGRTGVMTPAEMERLITDAGRIPAPQPGW